MAGLIAFVLGIPVLKLKGHYLAMATLGFGIIIYRIVLAAEFFGEADGISDVPPFTPAAGPGGERRFQRPGSELLHRLGPAAARPAAAAQPDRLPGRPGAARHPRLGGSGRGHGGQYRPRFKLYTFVLSAVFAAVAGFFLTHYNGGIGPSEASVMKSVRYVAIVAVGGMANLWGALVMGVLLNFLSLRGVFGSYDDAVFGAILILIMLFAPQGILSLRLGNVLGAKADHRQNELNHAGTAISP